MALVVYNNNSILFNQYTKLGSEKGNWWYNTHVCSPDINTISITSTGGINLIQHIFIYFTTKTEFKCCENSNKSRSTQAELFLFTFVSA